MNYDNLVNRAIVYIFMHVDEQIKVDDVADYCYVSKYHFSRVFKAATGESLYQFIKRIKLEQAAIQISTYKIKKITDVAGEFGYESANFNHAFKNQFKMSPKLFRENIMNKYFLKKCSLYNNEYPVLDYDHFDKNITYKVIEPKKVYYKRHIGHYKQLPEYWCEFFTKYSKLKKEDKNYLEISYNDPSLTDENRCIMDLCVESDNKIDGLSTQIISGGKYAIYHYKGHKSGIFSAYQGIFNSWLSSNNIELINKPFFMEYLKIENDLFELDIYIPILK